MIAIAFRFLVRVFSYIFHFALGLFLAGISLVALQGGNGTFALGMTPWWTGQVLAKYLLAASVFGLLSVILAARGTLKVLFFLWASVVAVVVIWAVFPSKMSFDNVDQFKDALWLVLGSIVAWLGAFWQMFRKR